MLWFFLFIVALIIFTRKVAGYKVKGWFGEKLLAALLYFSIDHNKCAVLHNIMLPTADGATTQIDHIVVSPYGIFVIETKTYKGWIFGNANQPKWTQVFYKKKSQFQNPLRQNYKHIITLSECLGVPSSYFKPLQQNLWVNSGSGSSPIV